MEQANSLPSESPGEPHREDGHKLIITQRGDQFKKQNMFTFFTKKRNERKLEPAR